MDRTWTRGVFVSHSHDKRVWFIAAARNNGEHVVYHPDGDSVELGQCVEFIAIPSPGSKGSCKTKAWNLRKIPRFVDVVIDHAISYALLILDIVDVNEKYNAIEKKNIPAITTNFITEVWDVNSIIDGFTINELRNLQILCRKGSGMAEQWTIRDIRKKPASTVVVERSFKKGFIFRDARKKTDNDLLFIWVPHRKKDIPFPYFLRKNRSRQEFCGRWVAFTLNEYGELDEFSDVHPIEHCFKTRKHSEHWEIKVPMQFDYDDWDKKGNPELYSDVCGRIGDSEYILEKYNKLHSFSGFGWIRSTFCSPENNIRLMLSDFQDQWQYENRTIDRDYRGRHSNDLENRNDETGRQKQESRTNSRMSGPSTIDQRNYSVDSRPRHTQRLQPKENINNSYQRSNFNVERSLAQSSTSDGVVHLDDLNTVVELTKKIESLDLENKEVPRELFRKLNEQLLKENEQQKIENDVQIKSLENKIQQQGYVLGIVKTVISDPNVHGAMFASNAEAAYNLYARIYHL